MSVSQPPRPIAEMTDAELLKAFGDCRIPEEDFGHADHVRLAWIVLERHDGFWEAVDHFRTLLLRFVEHLEVRQKYHETVTVAYMSLVNERRVRGDGPRDWPAFAEANADLLRWHDGPLWARYDPSVLLDPVAKEHFILPQGPLGDG